MIANKLMRAFYLIDLEGEAANLDFLLGQNFGIQRVTFGSQDFSNDLDAAQAAQCALEYFLDNPRLDVENATEKVLYNPEFYPSIPPITPTAEDLQLEAEADERAEELMESPEQVAVIVTKRFDTLGDYVTARLETEGSNFKLSMRIAINPDIYMEEKGKSMEDAQSVVHGPHRELTPTVNIH